MDDRSGIRIAVEVKLGDGAANIPGLKTLMDMAETGGIVLSGGGLEEKSGHVVVPASVFLALV